MDKTFAFAITYYTCKGVDFLNKRLIGSWIKVGTFDWSVETVLKKSLDYNPNNSDVIVDKFKQMLDELKVGEFPIHATEIHKVGDNGIRKVWTIHPIRIS
jgi:hypothetical protein